MDSGGWGLAWKGDILNAPLATAQATEAGFYDTPGKAFGVAVAGDYAYVADGDGGLVIPRPFLP